MMTLNQAKANRKIADWVEFFRSAEIPVLRKTAVDITQLRDHEDDVGAKQLSRVVINDPLMMCKVLSYANNHRGSHQLQDLVQIEQAIIMMGTSTFFEKIPVSPLVEEVLKQDLPARLNLLKLMARAHKAGYYAADIAAHLMDLHAEELRIAASLYEVAEMLMWCFNAEDMLVMAQRQAADKTLRSKVAQQEVLGFKLMDLQVELVHVFNLPTLLIDLMDDAQAHSQRVKNVKLAVNLARHSSEGWDNAALPDDYREIAQLMRVDVERVMHIIGVPH